MVFNMWGFCDNVVNNNINLHLIQNVKTITISMDAFLKQVIINIKKIDD